MEINSRLAYVEDQNNKILRILEGKDQIKQNPRKALNQKIDETFTINEQASHSLTGRMIHGKMAKPALQKDLVDKIIDDIKKKWPAYQEKDIRSDIRAKLNNAAKRPPKISRVYDRHPTSDWHP